MPSANILPDLMYPNLKLIICGTAAGSRSAKTGMYYANKSNKFWRVLYETGLTPQQLHPKEYSSLPKFGIGLTDLAKYTSGPDANLHKEDFDVLGFHEKLVTASPNVLAFNGKNAAKVALQLNSVDYGLYSEQIRETLVYVLPSTSYKASKHWDISYWQDCARQILKI